MNKSYLGIGSNQKCPERQIRQAITALKKTPKTSILRVSPLFWSKAWGLQRQQDFCNVVVEINTSLTPLQLLRSCQRIEKSMGRVRKKKWGPRTLDIDILTYAELVIHTNHLTLPHPHILTRDFVMYPLSTLSPKPSLFTHINKI